MMIDLCILTVDLLPLYAEDLLSPETRQLLEEHAAGCPACAARLRSATGPELPALLPAPPAEGSGLELPARRFFGRLRRILLYVTAFVTLALVVAGSLGFQFGRRAAWSERAIATQVAGSDELARRAVPGWARAEEQGLVVDLGITERIRETEASITFEKAWYSGRQVYILYTVRAPEGEYAVPTWAFLYEGSSKAESSSGATDWNNLQDWGGFSSDGFHSVLIFDRLKPPIEADHLRLQIRQWVAVTAREGADPTTNRGRELNLDLPWRPEFLREPSPEVLTLTQRHTWLGRTLALERAEVWTGQIRLFGWIELPEGERNPALAATLLVGGKSRQLKEFKADPEAEPGRYRFAATFDGPDQWPAELKLEVGGIGFETDQVLEWPVNWTKYGNASSAGRQLMLPEDQVAVKFYDSTLTTIFAYTGGVAVEVSEPSGKPPYVRADLAIGGRGQDLDRPGFEVVNAAGEAWADMGGGGGVIYDDRKGRDQRQGVSANWDEHLPESFRQSDRLVLRYYWPSATMVLKETWTLAN